MRDECFIFRNSYEDRGPQLFDRRRLYIESGKRIPAASPQTRPAQIILRIVAVHGRCLRASQRHRFLCRFRFYALSLGVFFFMVLSWYIVHCLPMPRADPLHLITTHYSHRSYSSCISWTGPPSCGDFSFSLRQNRNLRRGFGEGWNFMWPNPLSLGWERRLIFAPDPFLTQNQPFFGTIDFYQAFSSIE